jgi:hypothetical protein
MKPRTAEVQNLIAQVEGSETAAVTVAMETASKPA